MAEQVPIFVTVRDRLSPLLELLDWLESAGQHDVHLIDNASTYPPLRDFLSTTSHRVVALDRNLGHRAAFLSGVVQREARDRAFVVTDPDVVPDPGCPLDVLEHLSELLARFPDADKIGLGLRLDDLPACYALREDVIDWEGRFWEDEIAHGVYRAGVDTTFALHRPRQRGHEIMRARRTGLPYVARHLPWYVDSANLSDEDRYYRAHADRTTTNWDQDVLPWWKQRRLESPATGAC